MRCSLSSWGPVALAALLVPTPALAGRCDTWLARADKTTGADLVTTYDKLAACDADLARTELVRFAKRATDLDTLLALGVRGVEADAFTGLWAVMDAIAYDQREGLATGIGEACGEHPKVVTMLQAAYVALKGTEFAAWLPALAACETDAVDPWLDQVVLDPPASEYNGKYNAMLTAVVDRRGVSALDVLERAAVAAAAEGPLNNVLDLMQRAIQPASMREAADPANEEALAAALVRIAEQVAPEPARRVADRLYTAGREAQAAALLPRVYPDAVQPGGGVMWGGAAIEACDGKAVVHWTTFVEAPPVHWAIQSVVEGPLRTAKPRLKCDDAAWPVRVPDAPFANGGAARAWADGIAAELAADGTKVKAVEDKGLL